MAISTKELELLLFSEKRYAIYVVVLILVSIPLLYIFLPWLPWTTERTKIILTLLGLFGYTILARIVTPKRFAKIELYTEIFVNVCAISLLAYLSGGVISPFNIAFIIPVTFAVFLVGTWFGFLTLGVSIAIIFAFIFLPAGIMLSPLQALAFFLIYAVLLSYLASILLFLKNMVVRLESAKKAAQEKAALFEEAMEHLKALDRLKTEFITRASHQLRTPLSELKWGLDTFLAQEMGPLSEKQKEFTAKMAASVNNLVKLVGQLLDIGRIEASETQFPKQKIDLLHIIDSIIAQYRREIGEKQLFIDLEKTKGLTVEGEEDALNTAFHNVIENAIRYTRNGGKITISFETQGDLLQTIISDDGIGIPKEEQKLLFSRFFRGSNASRLVSEGTGLGLSITRGIIERHKGHIAVESEEGIGTKVTILLPRAKI